MVDLLEILKVMQWQVWWHEKIYLLNLIWMVPFYVSISRQRPRLLSILPPPLCNGEVFLLAILMEIASSFMDEPVILHCYRHNTIWF